LSTQCPPANSANRIVNNPTLLPTVPRLIQALAKGELTSRELIEQCLANIEHPEGEGSRVYLKIHASAARASAERYDRARRSGSPVPKYAGIPISIKDLFDLEGDVTTAGSLVLRGAAPATRDAEAVLRLKAAGFIVMGRTNMTEFAYSGLGLNPHYGTPRNPWDRPSQRIPGGSSSGGAVSVTDAMAVAAFGTDTGGSCRIPAAFCGIVGFKPTARRVPSQGAFPLSRTLDSIGPIANSVECCAILDAVLSGDSADLAPLELKKLRLGVLTSYVTEDMRADVAAAYSRALQRIAASGVSLIEFSLPELKELPAINSKGGFAAVESYALHREMIATGASQYDPRVLSRMLRGREQSEEDERELHRRRDELIDRVQPRLQAFDAWLMPSVPITAPRLSEFDTDAVYYLLNALVLRNPSVVNFLDGCAISVPCHSFGEAPVGLTIAGMRGADRKILAVASAIEACLA
jgi:aspartyl-tRNA(Asn)/glutamyl-tRNA(Gln) amidotransferase subunit A